MISIRQLLSNCKWSQFSLVVDYDYKPDLVESSSSSSLQQYSLNNTLKPCEFIGLQTVPRTSLDRMHFVEMPGNNTNNDRLFHTRGT